MNYIIATYAGTANEFSLEIQMQNLFTILLNKKTRYIKQVTIVCPPVKLQHTYKKEYYNWNKWIELYKTYLPEISLIYMDYIGENIYASYDQWIQAMLMFPQFDYHLFIEDDYCIYPSLLDFDVQLVDAYNNLVGGDGTGYVCTYADAIMGHPYHAAISNGIINKKTLEKFKGNMLTKYYKCVKTTVEQVAFSDLFLQEDISVYSLHKIYTALFWSSYRKQLESYSQSTSTITPFFIPIQFLLHQVIMRQ